MASSKERERRLARAKTERQLRYRAEKARRQRQIRAGVGIGLAAAVVLGLVGWSAGWFDFSSKKTPEATGTCAWTPDGTAVAGTPKTSGEPRAGTETMTLTTSLGVISIDLDLANAPCTAASFKYLADKGYFNGTACHKLFSANPYALVCGSKDGRDTSNAGYRFPVENIPPADAAQPSASPTPSGSASASASPTAAAEPVATYVEGTVVLAASGVDGGGTQFMIFFKDSKLPADYGVIGKVTAGQDIVDSVGAAGDDGSFAAAGGGGAPKKPITITTLTVAPPAEPTPTATASGSPTPSASASNAAN